MSNTISYDESDYIKKAKICNKCIHSINPDTLEVAYFKRFGGIEFMECRKCHGTDFTELDITVEEMHIITKISTDPDFVFAMNELRKNDIIEYNLKLAQFKKQIAETEDDDYKPTSSVPKCPICGSTNIKKISATKRILSVGTLGLAGSVVGKNQQCKDCGAKW